MNPQFPDIAIWQWHTSFSSKPVDVSLFQWIRLLLVLIGDGSKYVKAVIIVIIYCVIIIVIIFFICYYYHCSHLFYYYYYY